MKKSAIHFLFVGLLTFCMGLWVSSVPSIENRGKADIKIYYADSLAYDLKSVAKGDFRYYQKDSPRQIEFLFNGKNHILIERNGKEFKVEIDYSDRNYHDITFE